MTYRKGNERMTTGKGTKRTTEERFRHLQLQLLIEFGIIIFCVAAVLSIIIVGDSSRVIRSKVSTLIAANSRQLELNIDSYLDKVETTATLLFSDEAYYLYDASDDSIDDYSKVKSEQIIEDRIVDLGLMENFADFGIVYANDHTVGWISNVTKGLFLDGGMYEEFSGYIVNEDTEDGWFFGAHENYDRIYYVKRLNPNAFLLASLYTWELNSVFEISEQLQDMTIRLVDADNVILFSSQKEESGGTLPEDIEAIVGNASNISAMGKQYLVNSNVCANGWRVICSIPTGVILKEINELRYFAFFFAGCIVLIFVLIGLIMIRRFTRPMDGMVSSLELKAARDELSGLLNKNSFQDQVVSAMAGVGASDKMALVIIDMDNFKQINDQLGHPYGDHVIRRMGALLQLQFSNDYILGRIGGDEFAMYRSYTDDDKAFRNTKHDMEILVAAFELEFRKERERCHNSLSIGVTIQNGDSDTFEQLYHKTDRALYLSKRNGKNQYTFYQEGMDCEETQ
jgi:diguanylate cyclase (GGDEF)-like protein